MNTELTREKAHRILDEAYECNPGPWKEHSIVCAKCAERIAGASGILDMERSYVYGLLHDIGRRFGKGHLAHVYDGWRYMLDMGYPDVARICLTHSFSHPDIGVYIGNFDIDSLKQKEIASRLENMVFDDYDRLIQLCDCLAGTHGAVDMVSRMDDVRKRYGSYPEVKSKRNLELKEYFERLTGMSIYECCRGV